MIITREKGMRMWGGGSGNTSVSGASSGGGFSLTVAEGEGTGNAYTDFTYESGTLTLNKATEFVTVDFFNKLFTAYDANGNVIAPNNTTPTLDNIKFKAGAWTEQYLSALGQNSSGGGGGGGIELSDVWQSLKTNTDDYANHKINSAHIPDLSGTYATKTWVNQQGFVTSSGVTSVAMTVPTGLSVSGTPITSTGTLALTFTSGYSIPTTAKQGNWDTAYGWGNHATAGYASASSVTTLQGYFTNGVAKTAAKLNTGTTTYTAWGQTYWSSGIPQSVSGNMTSVGSITPSANGNALGTTSARFNIYGTAGNFSGNVSITGTLGVTGAATLSSSLSVASGITLTTTKKIYFGDTSHYLELDSTGFHFSHGVYSDSFVSALGANSSGGGGGGVDLTAVWASLTNTENPTYSTTLKINSNHIPDLAASKITSGTLAAARIPIATASAVGGIKVGTTLAISDGVLNQKSGIATAGTYRSVTVDTYGRVTAGTNPTTLSGYGITNAYTKTQVDTALSGYLPLSGGTITGNLVVNGTTTLDDLLTTKTYITVDRSPYGAISLGEQLNVLRARCQNAENGVFAYNTVISLFGSGETGTTVNNLGVRLGSQSGATWISAGESGKTLSSQYTAMCNTESVYITADNAINFITNCSNDGTSYTLAANLDSSGNLSLINSIYMKNAKSILFEDTDGTSRSVLNFSSNNNVNLGYGTATLGTGTYIYGKTIVFRTNSTSADAAIIDDSKNLTVKGYVAVGTGGASGSYVGSSTADSIYLNNSSGAVLVCKGKVVRRTTTLSDVTLGESAYPWLAVYATTFYGALSGNAATATKATQDGDGRTITSTYLTSIGRSGDYITQTKGGTTSNVTHILERNGTYTHSIGATGWYRIGRFLNTASQSASCILLLSRSYTYKGNESYAFSITLSYSGKISISQLAGYYHSTQLIDKIRVEYVTDNSSFYPPIDIHVNEDTTGNNSYRVTFIGGAQALSEFEKDPTLTGSTFEYTVGIGMGTATRSTDSTDVVATNSNGSVGIRAATNRGLLDVTNNVWIVGTNGTNTWMNQGKVGIGTSSPSQKLDVEGNIIASGYVAVGTGGSNSALKSNASNNIYLENSEGIPLVCEGLVVRRGASATTATLGNSDYRWGGLWSTTGNFSSTLSVTGASTLTGNITAGAHIYLANNKYINWKDADGTNRTMLYLTSGNNFSVGYGTIAASGDTFIIGTNIYLRANSTSANAVTISSAKNLTCAGEVTASSDERLKTIVGDGNLDLRYIANAPNILFKWNNGQDDKVHGGSLAQYFLHGAKHFVLGSDKDYYSLNYGALATSMAISIAKEVVKHDDEITRLKKEVVKLRERVAELEERRVA